MKSAFGKPLKITLLSSVFALTLLVGLITQTSPVSAATAEDIQRAYFLDADQIRVDFSNGTHTLLRDDNINDDTFEYKAASNDHSCHGVIYLPGNSNDGIFNLLEFAYSKPANTTQITVDADVDVPNNCQNIGGPGNSIDLAVEDFQKAKNVFRYEDSGTIRRVDNSSDWIFERSEENPTLYFRTTRTEDNGGRCKDFIQISSDGNSYRLFDISPDGGGGNLPGDAPEEASGCKYNDQLGDRNHIYGYLGRDGRSRGDLLPLGNTTRKPANPRVISATEQAEVGSPDVEAGEGGLSCEESGGSLSWIMCPLLAIMGNSISWLEGQMVGLLSLDINKYDNPELRAAWRLIRNFAYLILVPMILVMVISTALGYDFISAYTVKTALPRMVIATIFIALSYDITVFLVGMVQSIGHGVQNLMLSPFASTYGLDSGTKLQDVLIRSNNTGGNTAIAGAALAGYGAAGYFIATAGISAFIGGALLSFILGIFGVAALILFTIFLLLTFRQLIIVMLILLAPIAILSWIFPGRDKLFSLWNKTFWLMMWFYPLIMLAIAAGKILAVITLGS